MAAHTMEINSPPLSLVSREEWGAVPPTVELENLNIPCISVRFWLYTDTPSCTSKEECVKIVREIQQRDLKKGLEDVRYNFLIGGDGNAYEGRGYFKKPPKEEILMEIWGKYIEIGFIGDHRSTKRSDQIYEIAYLISEAAVKNGSLKYEAYPIYEDE